MIDIGRFAQRHCEIIKDGEKKSLRFGGGAREELAAELRRFADMVENGDVLIEKIQAGQIVSPEEWYAQALFIEFVEYEKEPAERKAPDRIIEV